MFSWSTPCVLGFMIYTHEKWSGWSSSQKKITFLYKPSNNVMEVSDEKYEIGQWAELHLRYKY